MVIKLMKTKEILKHWHEENGLITVKLAAEIIGIKPPSVTRAVDHGKMKCYEIGKTRFLSFNDVIFYKAQRESLPRRSEKD